MKRKDFLKGLGILGVGSVLPLKKAAAMAANLDAQAGSQVCVLIPSETAGPYPLNLSGNASMFRQDIRETQDGVDTKVRLKFFGIANCVTMQNLRVDIWHCNAHGYYSGYTTNGQQGSQNHAGETWLRGIQLTDANGEVEFITKFPGWYSGRVMHIHFQVFINSIVQATSQLTTPVADKNALYTSNLPYSNYGPDPSSLSSDNVFSDGYSTQMATLTYNSTTAQYEVYLEVGINGTGTVGLQQLEPETGGQFKLSPNYPNPFSSMTVIPFTLLHPSTVKIEIFDLQGKKILDLVDQKMEAGEQKIILDKQTNGLALTQGSYAYQLTVTNSNGSYHQVKLLTVN